MRRSLRRCALPWRKPWGSGSRASVAERFFQSTLRTDAVLRRVLRLGPCGRGRRRRETSTGARPSGTCARRCFEPCSSRYPIRAVWSPSVLVEVLDWTSSALDRVDGEAFFARFNEGEAVPYFYEPFLEAFDPELRKQLGVWYTPVEVVRYMVARVDRALKEDLDIPDGLAAENVYVLDPCCGTGAYLAEVLRPDCEPSAGPGPGRAYRLAGQASSIGTRVRVRDHARAIRRGPLAGRLDHERAGRPTR